MRRDAKAEAEAALLELLGGAYDLIVLARYMQILSPDFLDAVRTPIINIHHSFLPAFAGADPYAQAHAARREAHRRHRALRHRGARRRPDHRAGRGARDPPRDASRTSSARAPTSSGSCLVRAVQWHLEDRVLPYGNRTVVFL